MRKWIAVLVVLPVLACGPEAESIEDDQRDPVGVTKGDSVEVAEARDLIDTIVSFGPTRKSPMTPEEVEDEVAAHEEVRAKLVEWETEFLERLLLSDFIRAKEKVENATEQQTELLEELAGIQLEDTEELREFLSTDADLNVLRTKILEFQASDLKNKERLRDITDLQSRSHDRLVVLLEGDQVPEGISKETTTYTIRETKLRAKLYHAMIELLDALDALEGAQEEWR